jgi:DNA-directed RNA polymerase specialized sigma24 family protein
MTAVMTIAIEETHREVALLIYDIVHQFQARYSGDFDELLSEAQEHYARAYHDYRTDRGASFSHYVWFRVWNGLVSTVRSNANRARLLRRQPAEALDSRPVEQPEPMSFVLREFLAGLSEDAREVAKLALESPTEISAAVFQRGDCTPQNMRAAIREYLTDLGWAGSRIKESFREIRYALTEA